MALNIQESESAVILPPPGAHDASVIWLHGLGADGHDFVPIIGELGLAADHGIKFIFPHAPVRPIAINNNLPMRGWYDIPSLTRLDKQDEAGIRDSEAIVHGLIQGEIDAGIAARRIVLAGFSQGGAITLHAGLRYPQRLAGLLPLSTYLPLHDRLAAERSAANADVPILMCHGTYDPVLALTLGSQSRDWLRALGYAVDWREYPMQHQVCLEEIEAISAWLKQVLV
ncbi:MAG: carboxylesterase [Nevskia sp.]|nr:carboxylesterase [Nevskia sp.]